MACTLLVDTKSDPADQRLEAKPSCEIVATEPQSSHRRRPAPLLNGILRRVSAGTKIAAYECTASMAQLDVSP